MAPPLAAPRFHAALPRRVRPQKLLPSWRRPGRPDDEDYYLIDAPESIGDGFSFSGGKFADGPSKSDEWFAQGRTVKAHSVYWNKGKAKDPIFGLTMGSGSQFSEDVFRHTLIEMCYLYYQTNIMPLLLIGLVLDSLTSLNPNMVSTILLMLEAKSSNEQVSGYSGFALNAISRPMGKDLMAGHHVLEDRAGEELGNIIKRILR